MGFQNIWYSHPRKFGQGSRYCRVCSNKHGMIRKYGLNMCRQCFRSYAKDIGFKKGGNGGKTVSLVEGQFNDIKVEVTAEDGTVKLYWVHARRLSAKDATLSELKLDKGKLDPEFSPDLFDYTCQLACDVSNVLVTPVPPDAKQNVEVDAAKPGSPSPLNVGATLVHIEVTSADESVKQMYKIVFTKKQIPQYVKVSDAKLAMEYECPVSLSAIFQPITVKGSDPRNTFSAPIIDEFTKTSKIDPLTEMPLEPDWRVDDYELDKKISEALGSIPLPSGGVTDPVKLSCLGEQLKGLNQVPASVDSDKKFSTEGAPVNHTYQSRAWEKQLCQIFDETNPTKLTKMAQDCLQQYFTSLPKPGWRMQYNDGESPLDYLHHAACCYATAIKNKPRDANLHVQLGLVLEERYYAEDILGLKKQDTKEMKSFNLEAKESSKEEECAAICELRGVSGKAPLPLQLKAIDAEYHHLVSAGQSGKADHVMALFVWKSKTATQEGVAAQKAEDQESPLGQGYLKYLDALSLDETKSMHHFHVGRMLVIQGNYGEAVKRLEACLGWNSQYQMARFYMGFALSLQKGGPGDRCSEAISYLKEAMEALLAKNTTTALSEDENCEKRSHLCAEESLHSSNVHLVRGMIQLGKLLASNPGTTGCLSAPDVYHTAAVVAAQVLPAISRGDLYQQFEWVLFEAHSQLLDHLMTTQKDNTSLIAQRCQRLSALIKRSTIPANDELTALQERTIQRLVQIQPCSSLSLYQLGSVQLSQYDNDPQSEVAARLLDKAMKSFRASIQLEGKPAAGPPCTELTEQKWWADIVKAEEAKKKAAEPKPAVGGRPAAGAASGKPVAAAAAGRGKPAARGGAAAARGGAARGGVAATARGGAKGAAVTPGRGGAKAGAGARGGGAASKPGPAPAAAKSGTCCAPAANKPPETKEDPAAAAAVAPAPAPDANVPLNKKTYHARLGLARALSRKPDKVEATKYYHEVIYMAPEVHDAYIESADMLVQTDPMAAVDIYSKFPVSEQPTFDDAYIFGEIVRLLMKAESYDDPRLTTNLISMGRVLGLASLEKYLQILDGKFKTEILKNVYAGVNGKAVDDPDMLAFFKFKCWI